MQRYHAASCSSAVNNSAVGGASARDTSRAESSSLPSNFSLNPRRPVQLTPYKLRGDKEPLNSRLGPPDFHPPAPNCPEETLTREYLQSGYRETVEGLEVSEEVAMSTGESSKRTSRPQLVKLDRPFKLAEQWVNNMTKSLEGESTEVELKGRPPRLGLGATVPRHSQEAPSNDPVERKLHAKLDSEKRKVAKSAEESARDGSVDEDSEDEELESRTKAFVKKRAVSLTSSLQAKKKQK